MPAGLFSFDTQNLGDDMQAFAVLAHLDRVDTLLDRDHLADFAGVPGTTAVFNSWFILGQDFRRPSERLRPIWHGFSAGRPELVEGDWLAYLRSQAPIGCRDLHTAEQLADAGVDAHWTGCLTLFLGEALQRRPPREREGVLFVDVPAEVEARIPPAVTARAVRLSTFPAPSLVGRPLDRFAAVARLLDRLARAELVVTRRLHVALPAASVGTPVVVTPDPAIGRARRRFSGFEPIVPTVFVDELLDRRLSGIDWTRVPPASIPPELTARYAALLGRLRDRRVIARVRRRPSPLDDPDRASQRLHNAAGQVRPARLRLRLADRTFEMGIRTWSDRFVDVDLNGFPGLSKFAFDVESAPWDADVWSSWGALADLVVRDDERATASRTPAA